MKLQNIIILLCCLQLSLSIGLESHAQSNKLHYLTIETSHQAAGSASGGSIFAGFVLGPFLFFCSFICIWFNEKRAAIDSRRLNLAAQICEDVDVTSQASARSKDGRLAYGSGLTITKNPIREPLSGIIGPSNIKITRHVQVLEWRRHTRTENERTVQYYDLQWVSHNSQNQGLRHNSPANWFISNDVTYNTQVYLGGYNIDKTTADLCHKSIPANPTMENAHNILRNTQRNDRAPSINGEYIYFAPTGMAAIFNFVGLGEGTLRVSFSLCPTGQISICARSTGATFSPFPIAQYEGTAEQTNGVPDCCCCIISSCYAQMLKPIQTIHLVEEKLLTKPQMFNLAIKKSECFTLGVRIGAYLVMVLGICLFFSPITTILGYIPLVGGIISGIVGFAIFLAAVLVCIPLFFLAASIAWLRYHPKIGIALLLIGGAILAFFLIYSKSKGGSGSPTTSHFMGWMRYPNE